MTTKKPKRQPGEYIFLHWEGPQEEEYTHGHVTPEEFAKTMNREVYFPGIIAPPPVRHIYGMYVFDGGEDFGNPTRVLKTYKEPGLGRFKVTAARCADIKVIGDQTPAILAGAGLPE